MRAFVSCCVLYRYYDYYFMSSGVDKFGLVSSVLFLYPPTLLMNKPTVVRGRVLAPQAHGNLIFS